MKLQSTTIQFQRGRQKYRFEVSHNLDEFKLNIENALINWLERTDKFTVKSFCKYVTSKDPINLKCKPHVLPKQK